MLLLADQLERERGWSRAKVARYLGFPGPSAASRLNKIASLGRPVKAKEIAHACKNLGISADYFFAPDRSPNYRKYLRNRADAPRKNPVVDGWIAANRPPSDLAALLRSVDWHTYMPTMKALDGIAAVIREYCEPLTKSGVREKAGA